MIEEVGLDARQGVVTSAILPLPAPGNNRTCSSSCRTLVAARPRGKIEAMTSAAAGWAMFALDPRERAHASLRASDADRDVVAHLLANAYADGRLDREEHDQRAGTAATARTLGELPPLVVDLVPSTTSAASLDPLVGATPAQLRARADEAWLERRRHAVYGFVAPTLVCWAVYLAVNGLTLGGFLWPLIVMAATGVHLLRTATSGQEIRREELRRLEKQQAKALRKRSWRP